MMNYVLVSILAIAMGQVVAHLIKRLPLIIEESESPKKLYENLREGFKLEYIYSLVLVVIYNFTVYFLGLTYLSIIYMIAIAFLVVVFVIDYKIQLIPDSVQCTLGLVALTNMCINYTTWYDYLLGAIIGGGIFFVISILAKVIYKKEGMGFGDVKLMAAIGGLMGMYNVVVIAILSFFIGAVISIVLMAFKIKSLDSYIPFGPFIVIATVLVMLFGVVPFETAFFTICNGLSELMLNVFFKVFGGM